VLSFVEVALPIEVDRHLETVASVDFGGIDMAFTAHRKTDSGTGELLAFGYQFASPHLRKACARAKLASAMQPIKWFILRDLRAQWVAPRLRCWRYPSRSQARNQQPGLPQV